MRPPTIMFVACVLAAAIGTPACGSSEGVETAVPAPASVSVSAAPVVGQDEPITIEATGSFEADESSDVAPEASGRVVETPVDVGQFVRRGAPLVRLQGVDAGLRLDEARAAVVRAEANVKLAEYENELAQTTARRYGSLLATGDVSRTVADQANTQAQTTGQSVNTARASLTETRAQLALAEEAVSDVVVAAPFAGFISARMVSLGEYVQPSNPVVTLLKIDPLRLRLNAPGVRAGDFRIGQKVAATVDAFPGKFFMGEITAINPAISPASRSFTVEARVPNPDAVLKPGMFAVATVDQGRTARALFVPREAVIEDVNTNSFRVFVIDSAGRARLRVVQLAARQSGDRVEILSGIEEGERVATSNLGQLSDRSAVEIVSAAS